MWVTINGKRMKVNEGDTILEAAQRNAIYIPTLCHHKDLLPASICRICMVEINKSLTLQPACTTIVRSEMVIATDSPRVLRARRTNIRLILANHADNCLVCDAANLCELRKVSAELGVANSFIMKSRTLAEIDHCHPSIQRDLSKCILCRRCVRACRELVEKDVWAVAFRGHRSRIVMQDDMGFDSRFCDDCDVCAEACPVGALINTARKRHERKLCAFEGGAR